MSKPSKVFGLKLGLEALPIIAPVLASITVKKAQSKVLSLEKLAIAFSKIFCTSLSKVKYMSDPETASSLISSLVAILYP